jgi:hypothetical protein
MNAGSPQQDLPPRAHAGSSALFRAPPGIRPGVFQEIGGTRRRGFQASSANVQQDRQGEWVEEGREEFAG